MSDSKRMACSSEGNFDSGPGSFKIFETFTNVDNLVSSEISNGPSGSSSTFTFQQPLAPHQSNLQTEQTRDEYVTCLPKACGGWEVAEGGRGILQEADLPRRPSQVAINLIQEKRKGQTSGESAQNKRSRSPNWAEEEKHALLVLKLEALVRLDTMGKPGESWSKPVSKWLLERYNYDRSFSSCQQQWDTLLKQFKAIYDYEAKYLQSGTSGGIRFWKLSEHERSENKKLPQGSFYKAWYVLMESILQEKRGVKKNVSSIKETRSVPVGAKLQSSTSTITDSGNFSPGPSDANKYPSSSPDQVSVEPRLACFSNLANTQDSQQCPQDDDKISRIVKPLVIKQIELALKPLIRRLEEDKEKLAMDREKLAIEREKLAMDREKLAMDREKLAMDRGKQESMEKEKLAMDRERRDMEKEKLAMDRERLDMEKQKLDMEKQKLDMEKQKLDMEKQKLDMEKQKLDIEKQKLDIEKQKLAKDKQKLAMKREKMETCEAPSSMGNVGSYPGAGEPNMDMSFLRIFANGQDAHHEPPSFAPDEDISTFIIS